MNSSTKDEEEEENNKRKEEEEEEKKTKKGEAAATAAREKRIKKNFELLTRDQKMGLVNKYKVDLEMFDYAFEKYL